MSDITDIQVSKWYRIKKMVYLIPEDAELEVEISDHGGKRTVAVGMICKYQDTPNWIVTDFIGWVYSYYNEDWEDVIVGIKYNADHELDYPVEDMEHVEYLLKICQEKPELFEHVPYILRWLDKNNRAEDQPGQEERKLRL